MAKKTAVKKVVKKPEITSGPVPSFETRITNLENRIDRIVTAIGQSKSVKGM